jgi:hypothetical protein
MTLFIAGFIAAMLIDALAFIVLRKKYAAVIDILNARFG